MRLGNRYRLLSRIAAGGMGEVWRARDELLGREVAVKVLRSHIAADPSFREPLPQRGPDHRGAGRPRHRPDLRLRRADSDLAYLVMELVHGEPLSAILARNGAARPRGHARRARSRRPRRCTPRTAPGSSTATSSPATCSSRPRARSRSPTSASPAPWRPRRLTQTGHRARHRPVRQPGAGVRACRSPRRPTSTRSASWPTSAWPAARRSTADTPVAHRAHAPQRPAAAAARRRAARRCGSWSRPCWPRTPARPPGRRRRARPTGRDALRATLTGEPARRLRRAHRSQRLPRRAGPARVTRRRSRGDLPHDEDPSFPRPPPPAPARASGRRTGRRPVIVGGVVGGRCPRRGHRGSRLRFTESAGEPPPGAGRPRRPRRSPATPVRTVQVTGRSGRPQTVVHGEVDEAVPHAVGYG